MKPHNNDRADLIKKWFLEQPPEIFCTPSRFEAAITALLSHIESDGWQTMETAPRDENVLLATSGGWVGEARFELMHDQTWDWIWASGSIVHEQHKKLGWRPLPAPPEPTS